MKKLVTISRQYGSGGRIIGKLLADKLGVPFYDKEIIDMAAEQSGFSRELMEGTELKAKSSFAYNLASTLSFNEGVSGSPLSVNEKLFLAQFETIKKIGETGEGVIVGRCADYVLRDLPNVTNIFIYAEYEDRAKRAIEKYGDDAKKIKDIIATYDKARQNYYNYHTSQKWGEYKNYNMALNSSYITEEEAAYMIAAYVEHRRYRDENRDDNSGEK
jgi:CMP/dCMP kinase